ncbi:MAG: hypothetical protein COA44_08090 [Arcobacter sp.]|nr:MAG: hypothetical protein COA44_08090 [Arcobacter sp.]
MERVIKEKLEEIVELMNDPEETVIDKEVREKLELILALLNDPSKIKVVKEELHEQLEKVVALVNNAMSDPDIDIEYCIPEVETDTSTCDVLGDPYILVTYIVSEYNKQSRKFRLRDTILRRNTPESIANQVTFSIEEFKAEIDSVQMG